MAPAGSRDRSRRMEDRRSDRRTWVVPCMVPAVLWGRTWAPEVQWDQIAWIMGKNGYASDIGIGFSAVKEVIILLYIYIIEHVLRWPLSHLWNHCTNKRNGYGVLIFYNSPCDHHREFSEGYMIAFQEAHPIL